MESNLLILLEGKTFLLFTVAGVNTGANEWIRQVAVELGVVTYVHVLFFPCFLPLGENKLSQI